MTHHLAFVAVRHIETARIGIAHGIDAVERLAPLTPIRIEQLPHRLLVEAVGAHGLIHCPDIFRPRTRYTVPQTREAPVEYGRAGGGLYRESLRYGVILLAEYGSRFARTLVVAVAPLVEDFEDEGAAVAVSGCGVGVARNRECLGYVYRRNFLKTHTHILIHGVDAEFNVEEYEVEDRAFLVEIQSMFGVELCQTIVRSIVFVCRVAERHGLGQLSVCAVLQTIALGNGGIA